MSKLIRCSWVGNGKTFYEEYHDQEWGVPVYDDSKLFEMLILEGAQAGLSWEIVLKKRENYRAAFYNFDPKLVAKMTDNQLEQQLSNVGLIRNRLKIYSVRQNALVFLEIQQQYGSFASYIWAYVDGKPLINRPKSMAEMVSRTEISDQISKDLKKRGMNFVGSTIIYAFMQAIGMVDDHMEGCFRCG